MHTSGDSEVGSGYGIHVRPPNLKKEWEDKIYGYVSYNGFIPPDNVVGYSFFKLDDDHYAFALIKRNGVDAGSRRRHYAHLLILTKGDFEKIGRNPFVLKKVLLELSEKDKNKFDFYDKYKPVKIDVDKEIARYRFTPTHDDVSEERKLKEAYKNNKPVTVDMPTDEGKMAKLVDKYTSIIEKIYNDGLPSKEPFLFSIFGNDHYAKNELIHFMFSLEPILRWLRGK